MMPFEKLWCPVCGSKTLLKVDRPMVEYECSKKICGRNFGVMDIILAKLDKLSSEELDAVFKLCVNKMRD